ncbi:MAG: hypothetical protein L3J09_08450 [Flavobacteriaceae bacterium]|nr:hypothetical protein [Flavobacteriaceae bacterium]
MSIFKKLNKLLASMGSSKAMERLPVDTDIDKKTLNIGGDKIAESKEGQLWVGIQELTGYYFLETTIVSILNIKTFDGATLLFKGGKENFELKSDTQEIKSEFSNISNRFIAQASFDITKDEINKMIKGDFTEVEIKFKKKSILLNRAVVVK